MGCGVVNGSYATIPVVITDPSWYHGHMAKGNREHVIARRVRELRAERGLTHRALAIASGVPQSTICRLENGEQLGGVAFSVIAKVAQALGASLDTFIS